MPLFTYHCRACQKDSDILVRAGTVPTCEHCGSTDLEKKISLFAIGRPDTNTPPSCADSCSGFERGSCGSGMCGCEDDDF